MCSILFLPFGSLTRGSGRKYVHLNLCLYEPHVSLSFHFFLLSVLPPLFGKPPFVAHPQLTVYVVGAPLRALVDVRGQDRSRTHDG